MQPTATPLVLHMKPDQGEPLQQQFESQIKTQYGYDTCAGKLLFILVSLCHGCSPSTYLALKTREATREAFQYYLQTAPEVRKALKEMEHEIQSSGDNSIRETNGMLNLSDGTKVCLKLTQQEAGNDSASNLYVSIKIDGEGDGISLGISLETLVKNIEKDIIDNAESVDPKLVATFQLVPAFRAVSALGLKNIDPHTGVRKIGAASGRTEFMSREEMIDRFMNPGDDPDVQFIHDNLVNITQNLALSGEYSYEHHRSVAELDKGFSATLFAMVTEFISKNLDRVLAGTATNPLEIETALEMFDTIPPDILRDVVQFERINEKIECIVGGLGFKSYKVANGRVSSLLVQQIVISKNLDRILTGETAAHQREIGIALEMLGALSPHILQSSPLFASIKNKISFIENYTGHKLKKVAANEMGNLMRKCMGIIMDEKPSYEHASHFFDLEKIIINDIALKTLKPEFADLHPLFLECRDRLASTCPEELYRVEYARRGRILSGM